MDQLTTVNINNIKYIIKNKNDLIENTLFRGIQWNNEIVLLIGYWIKKYKLQHFLNIGCHIGTVSLPIARYIKKVTAIEPFPPTFNHFLEHIKINDLKNIETFNLALGDKEDNVFFLDHKNTRVKDNSGGMHAVTKDDIKNRRLSSGIHNKKYQCKMKKLDDLKCEKFDIILIDAEGRDYEIIKGGAKKILENKPIIIVEVWENEKRKKENMNTKKEDVLGLMSKLNFKFIKQIDHDHIFFPKDMKI